MLIDKNKLFTSVAGDHSANIERAPFARTGNIHRWGSRQTSSAVGRFMDSRFCFL
jgi:hypothetical protein